MVGRAIVDPYLASDLALFFILTARRIRSTCPPPFPLPLNESFHPLPHLHPNRSDFVQSLLHFFLCLAGFS
ncbi:hypothetical protein ISN45_Un107g000280 (mitochondrion) [Arabidopsis thaliana x Arabidopsis arenosa]|uniref:Uncharacterized protein n=2 Tax=Arabidopsis TaxID=3701 RepID=A0A8T1XA77_ARASU|nr:hypothetical protein ISN44_Un159g000050 [Arabidopsis suecica]KAG7528952.1 hypothetical protein ISN45_Un107g000280 [Arabidopsis thaliana x Arabidopsis arenosa]KAG7529224.1 hypothetical protein ISN44_Un144g000250 [Arabidopsis suecica]